jgi:ubiquinone/menaquinone biosynthesis C-methylase UbiE
MGGASIVGRGEGAAGDRAVSIAREFDGKASRYEDDRLAGWYRAQGRATLELLDPPAGGTVLDVGCGTGWLLRELVRGRGDLRGLGVDLSAGMIEAARARLDRSLRDRLRFVQADWDSPRTAEAELAPGDPPAAIVCVSTFHYFADPRSASRKMFRTLAPGGRLLLLDRALDRSVLTTIWQRVHDRWLRDHVTFYRTDELVGMLDATGFERIAVRRRLRGLFWKGKLYTSLVLIEAAKPAGGGRSA